MAFLICQVTRQSKIVEVQSSGGFRRSSKGGGGSGHPDPEIRGEAVSQKFFFGPSVLILVEK